jgi:hypothetical protein
MQHVRLAHRLCHSASSTASHAGTYGRRKGWQRTNHCHRQRHIRHEPRSRPGRNPFVDSGTDVRMPCLARTKTERSSCPRTCELVLLRRRATRTMVSCPTLRSMRWLAIFRGHVPTTGMHRRLRETCSHVCGLLLMLVSRCPTNSLLTQYIDYDHLRQPRRIEHRLTSNM